VTARVSRIERIRAQINELFASEGELGEVLEQVARLGARLLLQTALETEVTEHLDPGRYERRSAAEDAKDGSRNGYSPLTVNTTAGPVTLSRPKLRGTTQAFASRLLGQGVTRTNAIESLAIAGYVRGLSTRDIEASLAEALGEGATVSKSTVSRICEAIKNEFEAFRHRDLAGIELEYLYLDGSHFKMHPGAPAEPVLAPGASRPTGNPRSWPLSPALPSRSTRGGISSARWPAGDFGRRALSSPTAVRGASAPSSSSSRAQHDSAVSSTVRGMCSRRSPSTPKTR
jgi:hypothetical protein